MTQDFALLGIPENIVLDLDNTLYRYDICHKAGMESLELAFQSKFPTYKLDFSEEYGKARNRIKSRLGNVAASHDRMQYLIELFYELGIAFNVEIAIQLVEAYWSGYFSKMQLEPSIGNILNLAKRQGVATYLVTDLTSKIQLLKLRELGLSEIFKVIITSEFAGGDKSSGLPWALLRSHLIYSDSSVTWFVGDSDGDVDLSHPNYRFLQVNLEGHRLDSKYENHMVLKNFADLEIYLSEIFL